MADADAVPETVTDSLEATYRVPMGGPQLVPQKRGGALWAGPVPTPGENGGAHRPTKAWKEQARELRDRGLDALAASNVLDLPSTKRFLPTLKFLHEAVEGRPVAAGSAPPPTTQIQVIVVNGQQISF